jgi:hypothetical protein
LRIQWALKSFLKPKISRSSTTYFFYLGLSDLFELRCADQTIPSIIAVHNLGVHPIYTWTMKTPRSHESINRATVHRVHWLRDLLPCDILGARIASFGYESEPFMLDGPAALKMTAKRLLRHLRDLRSSLKVRRI